MVGATPTLDELVERIALRVVELLRGEVPLLDAAAVARRLGRSRDWVYRHADELGAVQLGEGDRPRLGFDPARVAADGAGKRKVCRRRAGSSGQGADLLPIRGVEPPC